MRFFIFLVLSCSLPQSLVAESSLTAPVSCTGGAMPQGLYVKPGLPTPLNAGRYVNEQILSLFVEAMTASPKSVARIFFLEDLGAGYFGQNTLDVVVGTIDRIELDPKGIGSSDTKIVVQAQDGTYQSFELRDVHSFHLDPNSAAFFAPATIGQNRLAGLNAKAAGGSIPARTPLVWEGLVVDDAIDFMGERDADAIAFCVHVFPLGGRPEIRKLEELGLRGKQLAAVVKMYPSPEALIEEVRNSFDDAALSLKFAAQCKKHGLPEPVPHTP